MPHNFEIRIFGICLAFIKPGSAYWEIIFPCDEDHPAQACIGGTPATLRENERVMIIQIPDDAVVPTGPALDTTPPPLFNISATYAHGSKGTPPKSNLVLKDLTKEVDPETFKSRAFVWLRVPHATLSSYRPTLCDYYVQDVTSSPGMPMEIIGKVAREIVLRFELSKDLELRSFDVQKPAYSIPLGNPFAVPAAGTVHSVEIDNDCHFLDSCSKSNDFLHLYRIVEDVTNDKMKFAAGQIKCPGGPEEPVPHAPCGSDANLEMAVPQYGNCDPVVSDPPPG